MTMRRAVEVSVTLLAAASVAVVVAWWGWRWFGPAAVDLPARSANEPVPSVALAVSPPFGTSREAPSHDGTWERRLRRRLSGDVRLLGVIAERDGGGHALFRFADGTARLVAAGTRLSDSATLVAVKPDGVTVRDAGGERDIPLRASRRDAHQRRDRPPQRAPAPVRFRATIAARWCASMPSSCRA